MLPIDPSPRAPPRHGADTARKLPDGLFVFGRNARGGNFRPAAAGVFVLFPLQRLAHRSFRRSTTKSTVDSIIAKRCPTQFRCPPEKATCRKPPSAVFVEPASRCRAGLNSSASAPGGRRGSGVVVVVGAKQDVEAESRNLSGTAMLLRVWITLLRVRIMLLRVRIMLLRVRIMR
jgi:hypothetical protein